jgi:CDP-glucose 4,6-dehydratase
MNNFFKNKKVLITGHTGFKGSWLTQILLNCDANIIGIALPPKTEPNLFSILKIKDKIKNYFADTRDFEKIKNIIKKEKPEIIFHLAAQPIVRDSYDDPLTTHTTNVIGTANVLQAIKETDTIRSAVIITTDKVYKNNEWVYPYRETDHLGGHDPYSASKAAADIITDSYIQSFFNVKDFKTKHKTLVAIARAGNVIGGGDWAKHRLVPDIIRSIYEKKEDVIIRSPEAIRPWEHVLEPLSGYIKLAQGLYEEKLNLVGAWNFGPNEESFVCVERLVCEAIKILKRGRLRIEKDLNKHEASLLMLDINKAKYILDWQPRLNFEENLNFTFEWYKEYYTNLKNIEQFTNNQIKNFFDKKL